MLLLRWRACCSFMGIQVDGGIPPEPGTGPGGAMGDSRELYERVAIHAERPGFRISEIRLSAIQRVPWHHHSNIQDTFYVLSGRIRITLQFPDEHIELGVGESWGPARAGRPHLVTNAGTDAASFLVLQGMGDYDFVPESE
jgi:quercetin dioxygenase-like cupin family protein